MEKKVFNNPSVRANYKKQFTSQDTKNKKDYKYQMQDQNLER